MTRRQAIQTTLVTVAALSGAAQVSAKSLESVSKPDPQTLWYNRPAGEWLEALPLGNGRLGAMVFGGVPTERLGLNESDTLGGRPA